MKIDAKRLLIISIAYINIPVYLFVLTWTKLPLALAFIAMTGALAYRIFRHCGKAEDDQRRVIYMHPAVFIISVMFLFLIGYFAGWGRFVNQAGDWNKHNAILRDLVRRPWPVYYIKGNEHSMLSYYIAQYLVPGAIGKVFNSFRVAEIALYIWNEIGLILVYISIVLYFKTSSGVRQIQCLLVIPFFSIPLSLSQIILKYLSGFRFNTVGNGQWFFKTDYLKIQYSNSFTVLRWVFPQAITIWLILIIFLTYRKYIEYYIPLMLPAILYGSFGFIGMVPLGIGYAIEYGVKNGSAKKLLVKMFSLENIVFLLTEGLLFACDLYGNVFGPKPEEIAFRFASYTKDTILVYFVFVLVNIIIYAVILWRTHRSDGIYYAAMITLIILPLFHMGRWNDLTMRASIPGLFVLMIWIIEYLMDCFRDKDRKRSRLRTVSCVLCLSLLLVGMHYPYKELLAVVAEDTAEPGRKPKWKSMKRFANRELNAKNDVKYNYYAYDIDDNFFYKYIASGK